MSAPTTIFLEALRSAQTPTVVRDKGKGKEMAEPGPAASPTTAPSQSQSALAKLKFRKLVTEASTPNSSQPIASTSRANYSDQVQDPEAEIDELEDEAGDQSMSAPAPGSENGSRMTEKEIMELWNREVPAPSLNLLVSWEPIEGLPALSRLLSKRDELCKLQREAGRDESLQLEARQTLATKLANYKRAPNSTRCHTGYTVCHFEGFCKLLDVPLFPYSDALQALSLGALARNSTASTSSRKNRISTLRSLFCGANEKWQSNDAFSRLYHFQGVTEALNEWANMDVPSRAKVPKPPSHSISEQKTQPVSQKSAKTSPATQQPERPVKRPRIVSPVNLDPPSAAVPPPVGSVSVVDATTQWNPLPSARADEKTPPPPSFEERPVSLPSPAPSASGERQSSPLRPPSRIVLAAQSALTSNDTSAGLPLSSLEAFFRALDPSLVVLAEPLHAQGLNTEEMLINFVSLDMRIRVKMVVLSVAKMGEETGEGIGVAFDPELLETLEKALENLHDSV